MTTAELLKLKAQIEEVKTAYDQAVGQLNGIKEQIKALGFGSIKELKEAREKVMKEIEEKTAELDKKAADFKVKYASLF